MLNQVEESQLEIDESYFPSEGKVLAFGNYEITTLASMSDDFKIFRKIVVKKNQDNPFTVIHYQLLNWKDWEAS